MFRIMTLTLCLAAPLAFGQEPLTKDAKAWFDVLKGNLVKAAEKMPEEHYSFKPADTVRSFGQLIGHVADAQFGICGMASGQKPPQSGIEKSKTTKADLVKALQDSVAFCDAAFADMTDTKGAELTKFFRGERPRLGILAFNTAHSFEHYGNIVTYMRIKGLVPPSSEGR